MKTYRLQDGLIGMPLDAHLMVIDELLDADLSDGEQRRELLINHELLAAQAEFFVRIRTLRRDKDGEKYVPLRGGRRAYGLDEFFDHLKRDPEHLSALTSLVRDALFRRFVEDVNEWMPGA
jgi:hypothetical protein